MDCCPRLDQATAGLVAMVAIVVVTRGSAQERRQKNRLIRCRWEPAKNETTVAEWLRQPAGQEREREERD